MSNVVFKKGSKSTPDVIIVDALQNLLTGSGIFGVDKAEGGRFVDFRMDYKELEDAYSTDWLSGKVCDIRPFDMTREWRILSGNLEPEQITEYKEAEKNFKIQSLFQEALVLSRIYGGAGLVLNVDDGNDPWEPLEIENVSFESLRWVRVVDRQYLTTVSYDQDPFSENYGYPIFYKMSPSSLNIHHTRVIRFEPVPLPLAARRRNNYWGKSVIERMYSALRNATSVQNSISSMIYEASVDVIKVPDLIDKISTPEGEKELIKRFGIAKLQKSINRMMILDAEEEYEIHNQSFAGLKDMIGQFMNIVAAASDTPVTRLLGTSPTGLLSNNNDGDVRNYYDSIKSDQETVLRNKLEYLDQILYRSVFGKPPELGNLDFVFPKLWQMTDLEIAQLELVRAQRDTVYLDRGVITDEIVAMALMTSDTYAGIDSDFIKELEENDDDEDGDIENEIDNEGDENKDVEGDEDGEEEQDADK